MPKNTVRMLLFVFLCCYLPHFFSSPWWLSTIVVSAILYGFLSIYYPLPRLTTLTKLILIIAGLSLVFFHYHTAVSSGLYIGLLLMFIAFKTLEIQSIRDLRILALCNFYVILSSLLIFQTLWIFPYVIMTTLFNFTLMLKLTTQSVNARTGKNLFKHFILTLPISLFLFYVFPRLTHPLWHVPSLSQTTIGFSEEMNFHDISQKFEDDGIAMRVILKPNFKATLYWRGLVLSEYNGFTWKKGLETSSSFKTLEAIPAGAPVHYEILLEPHQKRWLFYQDNPAASNPVLLYDPSLGLIQQNGSAIFQPFDYSIIEKPTEFQKLTSAEYQQNTQLPPFGNPKLRAWAKRQYALANSSPAQMIQMIGTHIHQQGYWYSLDSGDPGLSANLMDKFWFDTKRGYCEYYASAVTFILRSVGVPARIVIGYHGGFWNPIAQFLTVQQNEAHAWLEYWQDETGWQRFDPVSEISPTQIDPSIQRKQQTDSNLDDYLKDWALSGKPLPWAVRAMYTLDSLRFFSERWLLFYNQDTQHELLQKLGLSIWNEEALLDCFIAVILSLLLIISVIYLRSRHKKEPLLVEYHKLQQEMRRFGIQTDPPATVSHQLQALAVKVPSLKDLIGVYAQLYEHIRLQQRNNTKEQQRFIQKLFKKLRMELGRVPELSLSAKKQEIEAK